MADFPALPLWTDGYLADTRHLTTLEHGAYLLLLMEAWRRPSCSLPDDDKTLSRLAGLSVAEWQDIREAVMAFWKHDEKRGIFRQKRLTKEREYLDEKRTKNRASAAKRWNKKEKPDAPAMQTECITDAPTPTPIKKKEPSAPKKGTRLPDDWRPDQEWAKACGLSVEKLKFEFEQFRDYWQSESGQKAVKMDWEKTWRNRIRWVIEKNPTKKQSVGDYAYRKMMETKNAASSDTGSAGLFEAGDTGQRASGLSLLEDLASSKD